MLSPSSKDAVCRRHSCSAVTTWVTSLTAVAVLLAPQTAYLHLGGGEDADGENGYPDDDFDEGEALVRVHSVVTLPVTLTLKL